MLTAAFIVFVLSMLIVLFAAGMAARQTGGHIRFIDFVQLGETLAKLEQHVSPAQLRRINLIISVGVIGIISSWLLVILDIAL